MENELAAHRWQDVDLKTRTLKVRQTLSRVAIPDTGQPH